MLRSELPVYGKVNASLAAKNIWTAAASGDDIDPIDIAKISSVPERDGNIQDAICGIIYARCSELYYSVYNGEPITPEQRTLLFDTIVSLLPSLIDTVDDIISDESIPDSACGSIIGCLNELTLVGVLASPYNITDRVAYLASRQQDSYEKTDVIITDAELGAIPAQVKTNSRNLINSIPAGGVVLTAMDFGNANLEVSRALVSLRSSEDAAPTVAASVQQILLTVDRRMLSLHAQQDELYAMDINRRYERRRNIGRVSLTQSLGSLFPELQHLLIGPQGVSELA